MLTHNKVIDEALSNLQLELCSASYEDAIKYNSALIKSSRPHQQRVAFWEEFEKGNKSLQKVVSKFTIPKGIRALKIIVKNFMLNVIGGGKINTTNYPAIIKKAEIVGISFRVKRGSWINYEVIIKVSINGNN